MAGQALFAYRVQLPDGSETIRTGAAERPPTFGDIADYAANKGERFLGPVAMSPAPTEAPTPAAAPAAPAPVVPPPVPQVVPGPVLPSAVAPTGDIVIPTPVAAPPAAPYPTLLPPRPLTSQVPEMIGGTLGSVAAIPAGPLAPAVAPFTAGAGAGLGEAGQIGLEHLLGWPPAETGTFGERVARAGTRGMLGEAVVGTPLRIAAKGVQYALGPAARAAEEVAPILTREVPAEPVVRLTGTGLADVGAERVTLGTVLQNPEMLAQAAPEVRQQFLREWWQGASKGGASGVVAAWDTLPEATQQVLAGEQHGAITTLVDTLRGAKPPGQLSTLDWLTRAVPGGISGFLYHQGYLPKEVATVLGPSGFAADVGRELLVRPTPLSVFGALPQIARVASPYADVGLRAGGQIYGQRRLPP